MWVRLGTQSYSNEAPWQELHCRTLPASVPGGGTLSLRKQSECEAFEKGRDGISEV